MAGDAALAETSRSTARALGAAQAAVGVLLAGLGALTLFLGWRSLGWPLIHDAPLMHYVAWRIGEGAVPYRDLFDMNFAGAYLLHRLVLSLAGAGDLGFRLFDLGWLGGTGALIFVYCRSFGVWSAAAAALLFGASHLAGGAWRAGQRDFVLVVFLLAGAHGVARFWEEGRRLRPLALAGLALGAAVTVKPQAGLFWLALAGLAAAGARRRGGSWWAAGGVVILSGLLPPAAVALWLWTIGGLAPFLEILTRYALPLYSRLGRVSVLEALRWHAWGREILGLVGALAALSLWRAWAQRQLDIRRGLLLVGVGYGVVHFWAQGKGWEYHLYPLMGFGSLLAASGMEPVPAEGRRGVQAAILAGLLLLAVVLGLKGMAALEPEWILDKQRRVASLVRELNGRVPPGGTVQVLDTSEGGIHALLRLGLRQPTRFLYDFHFFHDVERAWIQGLRAEFLRDLRRAPPEFVVVFERGWPGGGYERLAGFPELGAWLEAGYAPDAERDGYRLYARRRDR